MDFFYDEGYVHSIQHSRKPVPGDEGEEHRDLAVLRVRFNRPIRNGDDWEDKGGFWANVEQWGPRSRHLECIRKGTIVGVAGSQMMNEWNDKDTGELKTSLVIKARSVTVVPSCIDTITLKRSSDSDNDSSSNDMPVAATA